MTLEETTRLDEAGLPDEAPASGAGAAPARSLAIDAVISPKVSFATHQNAVPVVRELRVANLGEAAVEKLVLEIEADPPVLAPRRWTLDRIGPGALVEVTERDLSLNAGLLLQLDEVVTATVTLRVREDRADAQALAERRLPLELLARNEWGGAGAMPELLAAFVLPNDPAVSRVLKAAAETLRKGGRPDGIDGY